MKIVNVKMNKNVKIVNVKMNKNYFTPCMWGFTVEYWSGCGIKNREVSVLNPCCLHYWESQSLVKGTQCYDMITAIPKVRYCPHGLASFELRLSMHVAITGLRYGNGLINIRGGGRTRSLL